MIDGRRTRARTRRQTPVADPERTGFAERLVRIGVRADFVTAIGVGLAVATAIVVGLGHLWVGVILLTAGGLMDTLDGVVAKAAGTVSARGAFLDSVADRLSDALIFSGVAWFLLTHHDPRTALLPIAILGIGGIVSYERAKAESLGFTARGGLMERAERLILLGLALAFNVVLLPLLGALLALTTITAAGRFVRVWRQASGAPAAPPRPLRLAAESRWRTWRATAGTRVPRRSRRELEPLTTRLRVAFGASAASSRRARRPAGRTRTASAFRRRFDAEH